MSDSDAIRAELRGQLDGYTADIKMLVDIKPKQFEILRIAHMVAETPPRKWNAAQAVVNATILKKDAQQKLKMAKATAMMTARHKPELKAAPDRQAWVEDQAAVQRAEVELINAEAELLAAQMAYECLDDLFTAGKKIMEYLVKTDQAERQYNRFAEEGKRQR